MTPCPPPPCPAGFVRASYDHWCCISTEGTPTVLCYARENCAPADVVPTLDWFGLAVLVPCIGIAGWAKTR